MNEKLNQLSPEDIQVIKDYYFQNPQEFTTKFRERYQIIDRNRRELELLPTKESRLERISELLSGSQDE
jgi:hypothetical protein